jgi:hypothetical protein
MMNRDYYPALRIIIIKDQGNLRHHPPSVMHNNITKFNFRYMKNARTQRISGGNDIINTNELHGYIQRQKLQITPV